MNNQPCTVEYLQYLSTWLPTSSATACTWAAQEIERLREELRQSYDKVEQLQAEIEELNNVIAYDC